MKNLLKQILRENLIEADLAGHSIKRMMTRLNKFSDEDISKVVKGEVIHSLNIIQKKQFKPNDSFGIRLGTFKPNPESHYYVEEKKGIGYYKIKNIENENYSIGNEFWVIVRGNEVTTFMLRKSEQKSLPIRGVDSKDMIRNVGDLLPNKIEKKDTFKKIKLINGTMVMYYELTNRFEDMNGNAISNDDIFDSLTPEHQEKVLSLTEGLIDEEYPTSFNKEEFANLNSFAARVRYCEEHLDRISSGSSRIVYKIDEEKVLKLAKNKKGLAQNETEIEYSNYYDIEDIVAKVFDKHPRNLWVEMELARKVSKGNFSKITGLNFDEYGQMLKVHSHDATGRGPNHFSLPDEVKEKMWENPFSSSFMNFIGNYGIGNSVVGDLTRTSSYGIVKRNGEDEVVLIDYGLTSEVYDSYYS